VPSLIFNSQSHEGLGKQFSTKNYDQQKPVEVMKDLGILTLRKRRFSFDPVILFRLANSTYRRKSSAGPVAYSSNSIVERGHAFKGEEEKGASTTLDWFEESLTSKGNDG